MGTHWTVWPLDEEMRTWLDSTEVPYPDVPSRFPTGKEIKGVLETLQEFDIKYTDNGIGGTWQAFIVSKAGGDIGEWTLLNVSEYFGDDEAQKLWIEKGWESLIKRITRDLAVHCGPLVLIADSDGTPAVILPPSPAVGQTRAMPLQANEEILAALTTDWEGERTVFKVAESLRRFDEVDLFNTLFPICVRAQGQGLPVAMAAYVIAKLNAKCPLSPVEAVERLLPEWDISIEEVVFYLGKQFDHNQLESAIRTLRERESDAVRLTRLKTISYWLGVLPKHLEDEAKLNAVAYPPLPGEDEITDANRFRWMIRFYLRRPKTNVRPIDYASGHTIYADPEGNPWHLVMPAVNDSGAKPLLRRYRGILIGADNLEVEPPIW